LTGTPFAQTQVEVHMTSRLFKVLLVAAALVSGASSAQAQPVAEIGASLVSSTIELEDEGVSTLGVPSGGFGILNPGMFASFFVGTHLAIEPQIGLIWASFDGESEHILNFVGQVDYFLRGTTEASPYVFGAAGVVDMSDSDYTPKSFGFGAGYRIPVGDRLTFRVDGRYTRFTGEFEDDDSNALAFTLSIGGVFGR
jgi:hypothetical protein